MRTFIITLTVLLGIVACTPFDKKKLETPAQKSQATNSDTPAVTNAPPPKNGFVFFNIDNKVFVYVNDSLAYESDLIYDNPKLNIPVELTSFLKPGSNKVQIKLWNEGCDGCHYNFWYIRYELYEADEVIDYFYDDAKRVFQEEGWKFDKTYDLYFEEE